MVYGGVREIEGRGVVGFQFSVKSPFLILEA